MIRKNLSAGDLVTLVYLAIVMTAVVVFHGRIPNWPFYLKIHGSMAGIILLLAYLEGRFGSPRVKFLHAWIFVAIVPACFKQIGPLLGHLHPYEDRAWDFWLHGLDLKLLGNVGGFVRSIANRPVADVLTIGYWSYYPLSLVLGIALWRQADRSKFREITAVLLTGWFASYLGYFLVPAVGPHKVIDELRAPELSGMFLAGPAHEALMKMEGDVPDAFPSGHALIAMLVLILSFKHHRKVFWWLLPFASCLILATMYLRYHYVVDVIASMLLVPPTLAVGTMLARSMEKPPAPT